MLRKLVILAVVLAIIGAAVFWVVTIPATIPANTLQPHTPSLANGRTMFFAGGCASCHATPRQDDKTRLSGGVALKSPVCTLPAPHISPPPTVGNCRRGATRSLTPPHTAP